MDKLALAMLTAKDVESRQKLQCEMAKQINIAGNMAFGAANRYFIIRQPDVKGMRGFTMGTAYVWYLWKDKG